MATLTPSSRWSGILSSFSHHVGRRTSQDANIFAAKLSAAVSADRFQISTDGFDGYPAALESHLGGQIDYAQLIKSYSGEGLDDWTAASGGTHRRR